MSHRAGLLYWLLLLLQPLPGNFYSPIMDDDLSCVASNVELLQRAVGFTHTRDNSSVAKLLQSGSERKRAEKPKPQAKLPATKPLQVRRQMARPPAGAQQTREPAQPDRLPLLPYPARLQLDPGEPFELSASTRLVLGQGVADGDLSVRTVRELLPKTASDAGPKERSEAYWSVRSEARQGAPGGGAGSIELELSSAVGHPEGYTLQVQNSSIVLKASTAAGLFYGSQTLKQLVAREGRRTVPALAISDQPRFQWRGLHLDVSRHFFTAEHVKRLLDTMASFKLNRFHWHLTDDQGWRLPVGSFPRLTQMGAASLDGAVEAYTEAEIRDVVAYARERNIEVLPEVDLPGHAAAAIAAYPELGNTDIPDWEPPRHPPWQLGVHEFTLAPSPKVVDFMDMVYQRVADLFPGTYVHIGGDEAPTGQWSRSQFAQSVIQNGTDPVQGFFNARSSQLLQKLGKTPVGWDEVQHMGGLPQDAVIMAWRGSSEVQDAVQSGRPVVNSDKGALYFDYAQGPTYKEPEAICCEQTRLETVYNFDPMPEGLTEEQQKLVLGPQGQLWSEHFPTWHQVEYMAFPRSMALAERAWTPSDQIVDFSDFRKRLLARLPDLDSRSVAYRQLDDVDMGRHRSWYEMDSPDSFLNLPDRGAWPHGLDNT